MKLYSNFQVVIKVRSKEIVVPYRYRVKQGDSEAPILFIFAMQLVAVEIYKEFKKQGIKISEFTYYKNSTMISQNKTIYYIWIMELYHLNHTKI